MSTVIPPPPPIPGPAPLPAPGPPASRGCWKIGLMGCGIVGILCLILIIGGVVYLRSHPEAFTDFLMGRIEATFAPDVTDQDKADLRAAYGAYREKLKTRSVSSQSLDRVRVVLMRGGSNITRDQVHELTAAFREAAGAPRPSEPATEIPISGTPGPLPSPSP